MTYKKKTHAYTQSIETRRVHYAKYANSYHYYGVFRSAANILLPTLPALIPRAAVVPDTLSLCLYQRRPNIAESTGNTFLRGYQLSPIIYRTRRPHILKI